MLCRAELSHLQRECQALMTIVLLVFPVPEPRPNVRAGSPGGRIL